MGGNMSRPGSVLIRIPVNSRIAPFKIKEPECNKCFNHCFASLVSNETQDSLCQRETVPYIIEVPYNPYIIKVSICPESFDSIHDSLKQSIRQLLIFRVDSLDTLITKIRENIIEAEVSLTTQQCFRSAIQMLIDDYNTLLMALLHQRESTQQYFDKRKKHICIAQDEFLVTIEEVKAGQSFSLTLTSTSKEILEKLATKVPAVNGLVSFTADDIEYKCDENAETHWKRIYSFPIPETLLDERMIKLILQDDDVENFALLPAKWFDDAAKLMSQQYIDILGHLVERCEMKTIPDLPKETWNHIIVYCLAHNKHQCLAWILKEHADDIYHSITPSFSAILTFKAAAIFYRCNEDTQKVCDNFDAELKRHELCLGSHYEDKIEIAPLEKIPYPICTWRSRISDDIANSDQYGYFHNREEDFVRYLKQQRALFRDITGIDDAKKLREEAALCGRDVQWSIISLGEIKNRNSPVPKGDVLIYVFEAANNSYGDGNCKKVYDTLTQQDLFNDDNILFAYMAGIESFIKKCKRHFPNKVQFYIRQIGQDLQVTNKELFIACREYLLLKHRENLASYHIFAKLDCFY